MKTLVTSLVLGTLLATGCDDPDLANKAARAVEHGAVIAQVSCSVEPDCLTATLNTEVPPVTGWCVQGLAPMSFSATKFADGSAVLARVGADFTDGVSAWRFRDRAEAQDMSLTFLNVCSQDPKPAGQGLVKATFSEGAMQIHLDTADTSCSGSSISWEVPQTAATVALSSSDCAGFNLESFGAE